MARGDGSIRVRVLGEVNDLKKKLSDGEKSVKNFGKSTASALKESLDDSIKGITGRFGKLGDKVGDSLSGIADKALAAGGTVGVGVAAGVGVAGAAIAGLAVKGVSAFVDLADKVRGLQQVTGATAEDSSALVAVMDDYGIAADQGAAAFFKLSRNIETNADKLRAHGIEIAKNRDGTVNLRETLLNIADAYQRVGGGVRGNAIVFDAFGRSGAALIPILQQGKDRLSEMFAEADAHDEILSQDDLDQARQYELAMDDLGDAVGGLQRELGDELVPVIAKGARTLAVFVDWINRASDKVGGLWNVVKTVVPPLRDIDTALGWVSKGSDDAAGSTGALGEATEQTAAAMGDEADETVKVVDALTIYKKALDDTLGGHLGSRDAARDLADAEDDLAEALGRGGAKAESAAGKTRTYQDALEDIFGDALDVADAHDSAADAVERLAEALGQGSENAADFRERLSKGDQTVEGYANAVRKAARDAVRAASGEVDAMAESGEIADTAGARKAALADKLIDLRNRFPQVAGEIDGYLNKLRQVPNLSTESQTATDKVSQSKKDLGEATDDLIEKARAEADQQDTVVGKYQALLTRLEELKTKYPEVAATIQQAINDTKTAFNDVWADPANGAFAAEMSRNWRGRNGLASDPKPMSGWGSGPEVGGVWRAASVNNNIKVDVHGLDPNAAGEVIARKIAWTITSAGRK